MARFILHIGPHKTGTTAIQQALVDLRPELAARGIAYPALWQDRLWGQHALRAELLAAQRAGAEEAATGRLRDAFAGLAAAAPCTLISTETLCTLPPGAIAALAGALAGHEVQVVAVLRRWPKLLGSAWQESVKQGGTRTLPHFAARHLADPLGSALLNFNHLLDPWAEAFGAEALRLVSYDGVLDRGDSLLRVLLEEVAGIAAPAAGPSRRVNSSLPPEEIEAVRLLNLLAAHRGGAKKADAAPRQGFMRLRRRGHPALKALCEALAPHVVELRLGTASPGLREIERLVLERHGARLLHGGEGTLFPAGAEQGVRHVLPDLGMWPEVAGPLRQLDEALAAAAAA